MKAKILGFIATVFFLMLRLTWRFKLEFQSEADKEFYYKNCRKKFPEQNFLLAFFHRDELSLVPFFGFTGLGTLVSISKDGEVMANVAKNLRYHIARGSSSKKAVAGLIAAMRHVKNGGNFSLAVDGPRGPIYQVKSGIIALNEKTRTPIIPLIAKPHCYYTFEKAWNKARFPYPFTKITLKFGNIRNYDVQGLQSALLSLDADDK